MTFEILIISGCPTHKESLLVLYVYVVIMSLIGMIITFKSVINLIGTTMNDDHYIIYYKRLFCTNIVLYWISFICYSSSIILCGIDSIEGISFDVNDQYVILLLLVSNIAWIIQLSTYESTNFGRLYLTLSNSKYGFNGHFSSIYLTIFNIGMLAIIFGIILYYLSFFDGFSDYNSYVIYPTLSGILIAIISHFGVLLTYRIKILKLLVSTKIKTNKIIKRNQRTLLSNFSNELESPNNKKSNSKQNRTKKSSQSVLKFTEKEKDLINLSSKLQTLSIMSYIILFIPLSVVFIYIMGIASNNSESLSIISNIILTLFGLIIKLFMYMHFKFGDTLYYEYFKCIFFRYTDNSIKISIITRIQAYINNADISVTTTLTTQRSSRLTTHYHPNSSYNSITKPDGYTNIESISVNTNRKITEILTDINE